MQLQMNDDNSIGRMCSQLDDLYDCAMFVSAETQGREVNHWEHEIASIVFAKICASTLAALRHVPKSKYYTRSGGLAIWDLSSLASLVRNLMEAYYTLHYILHDKCNEEERSFRHLLWKFHEASERWKCLTKAIPESSHLPEIKSDFESLKESLKKDSYFKELSDSKQKEILRGSSYRLRTNVDLSDSCGVNSNYYRAQYKYCSSFAHTSPFSISTLLRFRAGDYDSERIMGTIVQLATGYLSLSVRDFVSVFKVSNATITKTASDTIKTWQEILKWNISLDDIEED